MKLLVYIVALIIVLAIAYTISLLDRASVTPPMHAPMPEIWVGKKLQPVCPTVNTSDADVYRIDFLKILGGIDTDYILSVNLSQLNVTRYLIEYMKLGLLIPIGLIHNGSVYELHMLPVTEDDRENLTSRSIYICFPPRAIYPFYTVRNTTTVDELFIKNASILLDIPMIGTGEYNVWINIVTPPPYADLNLSISYIEHIDTVVGFVEIKDYGYRDLGAYPGSTYCGIECIFNYCYRRCDTYYYHVYRVYLHYRFFLNASGEIIDIFERVYESNIWAIEDRVIEWSHGKYLSFEPFAKVYIDMRFSRTENCIFDSNSSTKYCNITHYLNHFSVNYLTRGLRIHNVDVYIDNKVIDVVTGVEPINITMPHVKTTLSLKNNRFYIPIEFIDNTNICTYINAAGFEAKRCLGNTRKSFAGYIELEYVPLEFEWRWGEIVDVPFSIRVEKKLYPPPYAHVDLNKYGYLEEQVLKHVAKIIDSYSSSQIYRDFMAWVLATQIPVQMDKCSNVRTYMLVEALQDGCGSGDEKVEILSRILGHLGIDNEARDVFVETLKGLEIVYERGRAVIGYIDMYPDFYELSCCALYVGGRYMVVYDTVQNNVFSVLDKFLDRLNR